MAMTKAMDPERAERRRQQEQIAQSLTASGALDDIFARIDAGEPLTGHEGLLKGMLKATLERGCRPPVAWDHLEVCFASVMGPPVRQ
jgi:putative transposase